VTAAERAAIEALRQDLTNEIHLLRGEVAEIRRDVARLNSRVDRILGGVAVLAFAAGVAIAVLRYVA
jgi:hypothetical protein